MSKPLLEIVDTGFTSYRYEAAIDGWLLRTPRQNHPRRFMTLEAAYRALRKEVGGRGLEWTVPYERRAIEIGAKL